eukprot:Partr_v1_DN28536_c0_g1_i4_m72850 putative splicing factor
MEIEREGRSRRRTRWNAESERIAFPNLPTILPCQLDDEMMEQYMRILNIEELSRRLRVGEVVPQSTQARSRSPEPIYGPDGKRVNTREVRYREKLELERHRLIEAAAKADPLYRPPVDYRKPSKLSEKIYIPANDFPEINFIGLLIGPRGSTLRGIEAKSGGAKISIRGKGSAKEGKREARLQQGEDEELHAMVMGDTEEKVAIAVAEINNIIEIACSTPEEQNTLKKNQLRDLAIMNGTLKEDMRCDRCGEQGHRHYECPQRVNSTGAIVCRICNGMGHVASDCRMKNNPEMLKAAESRSKQVDNDYANFMSELIGTASGPGNGSRPQQPPPPGASSIPPWAQAAPPPWMQQQPPPPQSHSQQPPPPSSQQNYMYPPPPMQNQQYPPPPSMYPPPPGGPPPWMPQYPPQPQPPVARPPPPGGQLPPWMQRQ